MAKAKRQPTAVDDWMGKLGQPHRAIADALRDLVKEVVPDVQEEIKWRQVCFMKDGNFAYMNTAKAHVSFGFFKGTQLDNPEGLLEGTGNTMRSIKVKSNHSIPVKQLKAWVRAAVELNEGQR